MVAVNPVISCDWNGSWIAAGVSVLLAESLALFLDGRSTNIDTWNDPNVLSESLLNPDTCETFAVLLLSMFCILNTYDPLNSTSPAEPKDETTSPRWVSGKALPLTSNDVPLGTDIVGLTIVRSYVCIDLDKGKLTVFNIDVPVEVITVSDFVVFPLVSFKLVWVLTLLTIDFPAAFAGLFLDKDPCVETSFFGAKLVFFSLLAVVLSTGGGPCTLTWLPEELYSVNTSVNVTGCLYGWTISVIVTDGCSTNISSLVFVALGDTVTSRCHSKFGIS